VFTERLISNTATTAITVDAVDMDDDGDIEVVVAAQGTLSMTGAKIVWYENDGNQSFSERVISTNGTWAVSAEASDIDGDGDFDVLATFAGSDTIAWYKNDGNQNFSENLISTTTDYVARAVAADIDGDGDLDAVSASYYGQRVEWFENTSPDFGDAPVSYGTLLADNGARHDAVGPSLGPTRDFDSDGQPSASADGDGTDDDGVMFGVIAVGAAQAGVNIGLQGASNARVDAWIDFDANGTWDASDQILSNVPVSNGLQTLNFPIPNQATTGPTYARVRVSSEGGLPTTGFARDGEVEDYLVTIVQAVPQVEKVEINNNLATRSAVTSLLVTFDTTVDHAFLQSAFSVTNVTTAISVGSVGVTASDMSGKTVALLEFSGSSTFTPPNGLLKTTLADGNYRLDVLATQIVASDGGEMMTADYVFGGQSAGDPNNDNFFRWFGDVNGDGFTDFTDFADGLLPAFGSSLNSPPPPDYRSDLDHNGDGFVDFMDFASGFLPTFGTARP
jgi:hypothetical protein